MLWPKTTQTDKAEINGENPFAKYKKKRYFPLLKSVCHFKRQAMPIQGFMYS